MHWHVIFTGGEAACTLGSILIPTPLCPVLLHTIIHFVTSRSYKNRRSDHTAHGGMHLSHFFCKFFCVLLGHGCTSCYVFFCPSIPSLVCHLLWLRNQIVGCAFPSTPFLCSTRSHWSSLFIGDVVPSSALAQVPTCFLTETVRQVEATDRHNRRGGITRTGDKEHTRTALQNAANFPKVVFTTNNQMIQQCIVSSVPVQRD